MNNNAIIDGDGLPSFYSQDASANTACTLTIPDDPNGYHVIDWIVWSYSGAAYTTGGKLTVTIGGTTIIDVDIYNAGPGQLDFSNAPVYKSPLKHNESMVITLSAGGSGIVGKLNVRAR